MTEPNISPKLMSSCSKLSLSVPVPSGIVTKTFGIKVGVWGVCGVGGCWIDGGFDCGLKGP